MRFQRHITSLRNLLRDVRFGGRFLGGGQATRFAHAHATDVANSDYLAMAEVFGRIAIADDDVIVDVGCGKGRVINFLLSRGIKCEIIGIEIDPEVARVTARRLRHYRNVSIVAGSVIDRWPEHATIFYAYNPFDAPVVERFCDLLAAHTRPFVVLYYNCRHRGVFERRGFHLEFLPRASVPGFQRRLADTDLIHDFCIIEPRPD
ncbi:MAG TPA: class I SAM-dependent methyltransferase [Steroidobacteraceae bacterium]|jgi:SAM-dependent methyltransferase|nr:class I SAM-dependent methyltransferase [Steroidobacteraceae bacterium]